MHAPITSRRIGAQADITNLVACVEEIEDLVECGIFQHDHVLQGNWFSGESAKSAVSLATPLVHTLASASASARKHRFA